MRTAISQATRCRGNHREQSRLATALRVVPLGIAIAAGPAIDIANSLYSSPSEMTAGTLAQVARGTVLLALAISWVSLGRRRRYAKIALPISVMAGYLTITSPLHPEPFDTLLRTSRLWYVVLAMHSAVTLRSVGVLPDGRLRKFVLASVMIVGGSQVFSLLAGRSAFIGSQAYENMRSYQSVYALTGLTFLPALPAASLVGALPVLSAKDPLSLGNIVTLTTAAGLASATLRRSALAAALAGILALVLKSIGLRSGLGGVVRVGLVCVVAGGGLYWLVDRSPLAANFSERHADLDRGSGGTASGRWEFQAIAVEYLTQRPATETVLGAGFTELQDYIDNGFGARIGAHNDWIDNIAAAGLIGAACTFLFFLYAVRLSISLKGAWGQAAAVACGVSLAVSTTAGGLFDPVFVPLFVALATAEATIEQSGREGSATRIRSRATPGPRVHSRVG